MDQGWGVPENHDDIYVPTSRLDINLHELGMYRPITITVLS